MVKAVLTKTLSELLPGSGGVKGARVKLSIVFRYTTPLPEVSPLVKEPRKLELPLMLVNPLAEFLSPDPVAENPGASRLKLPTAGPLTGPRMFAVPPVMMSGSAYARDERRKRKVRDKRVRRIGVSPLQLRG
jgi:hypothetical protein